MNDYQVCVAGLLMQDGLPYALAVEQALRMTADEVFLIVDNAPGIETARLIAQEQARLRVN